MYKLALHQHFPILAFYGYGKADIPRRVMSATLQRLAKKGMDGVLLTQHREDYDNLAPFDARELFANNSNIGPFEVAEPLTLDEEIVGYRLNGPQTLDVFFCYELWTRDPGTPPVDPINQAPNYEIIVMSSDLVPYRRNGNLMTLEEHIEQEYPLYILPHSHSKEGGIASPLRKQGEKRLQEVVNDYDFLVETRNSLLAHPFYTSKKGDFSIHSTQSVPPHMQIPGSDDTRGSANAYVQMDVPKNPQIAGNIIEKLSSGDYQSYFQCASHVDFLYKILFSRKVFDLGLKAFK